MSGKKTTPLRNALREMRVSEPMRLKNSPSFRPPPSTKQDPKEVPHAEASPREPSHSEVGHKQDTRNASPQIEALQKEVPQDEAPPVERTQPEIARNELPRKESADAEPPQSGVARSEHSRTEPPQPEAPRIEEFHAEVPQIEPPRPEDARREPPQGEAVSRNEAAQLELTQNEQPLAERVTSGTSFFRLSDRAFSYAQLQRLSGDCFRLFLWMSSRAWRYLKSDGTLRASVGFIEAHTAMSHATISRSLRTLREEALIRLLETDYKRGNVWSVSPIAFAGCDPEDLPPRFEEPPAEASRNGSPPPSKRDRPSLDLRAKPPQNEDQIRSIKKIKNLSQEAAGLLARIEQHTAPEKRKSERAALEELLSKYAAPVVSIAIAHLDRNGVLGTGERCHSPFRYLTVAIDDVLRKCGGKSSTSLPKPAADREREEQHDEERSRAAVAAFEGELTHEERAKFVTEFVAKEFAWGYQPSDGLATRLAAAHWFRERGSAPRAAMAG